MSEQFNFEDSMNKTENKDASAIRMRLEQNLNKKQYTEFIEFWLNEAK